MTIVLAVEKDKIYYTAMKARTDEPPPTEEADDPFSLRACLASLFSWSPRMGS